MIFYVISSGITALLFSRGKIFYTLFNTQIIINKFIFHHIPKQSIFVNFIKRISLIIWDQILMYYKHCLIIINFTLGEIYSKDKVLFGKVSILFMETLHSLWQLNLNTMKQYKIIKPFKCRFIGTSLRCWTRKKNKVSNLRFYLLVS